jgi:hypothetical protein
MWPTSEERNGVTEPIGEGVGAPILGPRNVPVERENPSPLRSPVSTCD